MYPRYTLKCPFLARNYLYVDQELLRALAPPPLEKPVPVLPPLPLLGLRLPGPVFRDAGSPFCLRLSPPDQGGGGSGGGRSAAASLQNQFCT